MVGMYSIVKRICRLNKIILLHKLDIDEFLQDNSTADK